MATRLRLELTKFSDSERMKTGVALAKARVSQDISSLLETLEERLIPKSVYSYDEDRWLSPEEALAWWHKLLLKEKMDELENLATVLSVEDYLKNG